MPYYQDDYVTIYHGDCMRIMSELPNADLVLTDPPYGVGKAEWDLWDPTVLPIIHDCLIDGGAIFMWSSQEDIGKIRGQLAEWFNLKNIIVVRALNMIGVPFDVAKLQMQWAPLHYAIKGKARITRKNRGFASLLAGDIWETVTPQSQFKGEKKKYHPCQKSVDICCKAINIQSHTGELVLDPYCGAGTTLVAAKKLNRKCIGIEIEERYCEIAANRCRQMVMELAT